MRGRGAAKLGQVLGWVMSLMARFGRRDRDLVVEAIPAPGPWTRRMMPMARFRRAAIISGPSRVRSWWRSSSKTTSLTDVEPVLDSPVPLDPGRNLLGLSLLHRQRADQVDHLNGCPLGLTVLARTLTVPGGSRAPDLKHLSRLREVDPGGCPDGLGRCVAPADRER